MFKGLSAFFGTYSGFIRIGLYIALAASLFLAGWTVNGWRKDAVIAKLETDIATTAANSNKLAFDDLYKATTDMKNAALAYTDEKNKLTATLTAIQKDMKAYAKAHPLPADCKPDSARMHALTSAISKANASTH